MTTCPHCNEEIDKLNYTRSVYIRGTSDTDGMNAIDGDRDSSDDEWYTCPNCGEDLQPYEVQHKLLPHKSPTAKDINKEMK